MKNNGKIILLVEDEVIILHHLTMFLKDRGYEVLTADNGEKAIQIVRDRDFIISLILMDIDLGKGMNGIETAIEILEFYNIPIVFLTSHISEEINKKTKFVKNYGIVLKESNMEGLLISISKAILSNNSKMNDN